MSDEEKVTPANLMLASTMAQQALVIAVVQALQDARVLNKAQVQKIADAALFALESLPHDGEKGAPALARKMLENLGPRLFLNRNQPPPRR